MEIILSAAFILGALLIGAISPGPSFVLVALTAMSVSRRAGVATSIGMGVGGMIFSTLSLLGLYALLTNVPRLYFSLKVVGGLYLIYLGISIWQNASKPLGVTEERVTIRSTLKKSFLTGLITQISNPKTAIVYGSIFAALLPANIPSVLYYVLPPLVFLVEAGWYLVVTLILSTASPREAYLRSKLLFDRLAGGVMIGLGGKLVTSAGSD